MLTAADSYTLPTNVVAVVIGASAGGVEALSEILPTLPAKTPWPIIVVLHLPPDHESLLASIFARKCELPCKEPEDKEPIAPGIWFAPADYHLLVGSAERFALSVDEPVHHSRPSLDVLFECAADVWGPGLVCVVLTGASEDGAAGAKRARDAGGVVMVQDPNTALSRLMPDAAIAVAAPQVVAPLASLAAILRRAALVRVSA